MDLKHIAILGPGGNVGNAIITELLKDKPRFTITGITRSTSTYNPPPTITHRTVDYTSFSSLQTAFENQDAVVNCITGGATHYEPSKLIIDAAIAAGVKLFFANEFVGEITRAAFRRLPEAFVGGKCRIREYLEGLGREGKIAWTSLNGGPFFDMYIPNRHARIYGSGNQPLHWTPLPTMGFAAGNMLRNPDPIRNRPVLLDPISPSSTVTQNTLLRTLEKALDTTFTISHVDVDKIHRNALIVLEKWKEGGEQEEGKAQMGKAMKGLGVCNQFHEGDDEGHAEDLEKTVQNELVSVETMQLEDAVREALERYGENCQVVQGMYNVEACEL
ncbi:uncharacterized protein J4E79_002161 [Alternaria viburni]|uniref:uncharacterized protein n=1 Tax=Alternaria viburni TaxID=566460 RepID=UPI0020C3EFF0|nr:uncharacterized protein J4E79_002161 [Alternaria viburni]KAI4667473.1 hypothetical protein J4E79_002161 [Alternaria viburni]